MSFPRSAYGPNPHAGVSVNAAQQRGWGTGWPNCQRSRWITVNAGGVRITGIRREIAPLFTELLNATVRLGYRPTNGWCWGGDCRPIGETSVPSNHSWGLAGDIDAPLNPWSTTFRCSIPPKVINLWERCGFYWGGRYTRKFDTMHLEYIRRPQDVAADLARARSAGGSSITQEEDMLKKGISAPGQVWRMQRMINEYNTGDPTKGLTVDGDFGPATEKAVNDLRRPWNHQPINGVWDMDLANRVQDQLLNRKLASLKSDLINEIRAIPAGEKGDPGTPGVSFDQVRALIDGARIEGTVRIS